MSAPLGNLQAEAILMDLAQVFFAPPSLNSAKVRDHAGANMEARYKVLLDQIPAVVFMAYLDEGIGEAYVSPQIEASLGFTQSEWLEDPVRWYQQIHPEDKDRWSIEAAGMFLSGKPLRSAYRVMARDGHVVWFHCEARLVRREDGTPWFMHGVGFDITGLKETEQALEEERSVVSAIFDTVGALVMVLDREGRIVRFNRTAESTTGYRSDEVIGKKVWDVFLAPEDADRFEGILNQLRPGAPAIDHESSCLTRSGERRLISWSTTILVRKSSSPLHVVATGIDITERKRLEAAVLEISAREQRRIGQDLHDGLGQHLTGVAFLSKVLHGRLAEEKRPEAIEAGTIVELINNSIHMTRELARGLMPVMSDSRGLMVALDRWADEISQLFKIDCVFECNDPVLIEDEARAEHLFHMTQEAVNNAIKHSKARRIRITLESSDDLATLTIEDDGCGFDQNSGRTSGLGLRIMNYRAKMIGGSLEIESRLENGTAVRCSFALNHD